MGLYITCERTSRGWKLRAIKRYNGKQFPRFSPRPRRKKKFNGGKMEYVLKNTKRNWWLLIGTGIMLAVATAVYGPLACLAFAEEPTPPSCAEEPTSSWGQRFHETVGEPPPKNIIQRGPRSAPKKAKPAPTPQPACSAAEPCWVAATLKRGARNVEVRGGDGKCVVLTTKRGAYWFRTGPLVGFITLEPRDLPAEITLAPDETVQLATPEDFRALAARGPLLEATHTCGELATGLEMRKHNKPIAATP